MSGIYRQLIFIVQRGYKKDKRKFLNLNDDEIKQLIYGSKINKERKVKYLIRRIGN